MIDSSPNQNREPNLFLLFARLTDHEGWRLVSVLNSRARIRGDWMFDV